MRTTSRIWLVLVLILSTGAGGAAEPNEKAKRYLEVLINRPAPGYLFDQFYNAWLETSTAKELGEYLKERAEGSSEAKDDVMLALYYEKSGEDVEALNWYASALKKSPDSAEILYHRADLEIYNLAFDEAIRDLRAGLGKNPDEELKIKISKLLGKTCVRNGQDEEGLAVWRGIMASVPEDTDLKEDIVELELAEGLLDEAAADCKALIEATDNKYKAVTLQLRLGDIYQRADKKELSLEAYRSTLEKISSGSWLEREILAQIEHVFRAEDNVSGLQEYYEKLREADPKRVALLRRYGLVLHEAGDTNKAIEAFRELIRLTPGDRTNRERYIQLMVKAEKYSEAIEVAEDMAEQYPKDGEVLTQLASIQYQAGQADAACETLMKYLANSDKSEFVYLRTASMLKNFGRNDQAGAVYGELLGAYPKSVGARESRASHLYATGKKEEGIKAFLEIAEGAQEDIVLRVAKGLSVRREHEAALGLLKEREKEFAGSFVYLTSLYEESTSLKKHDEAFAYGQRRVEKASRISELEAAVGDAVAAAKKIDKLEAITAELTENDSRSAGQSCLLAEILDQNGEIEGADQVLADAMAEHGDSALVLSEKYRLSRRRGEWGQAEEALKQLMVLQPSRRTLFLRQLVDISVKGELYENAMGWIKEWKRAAPQSYLPYMRQAEVLAGKAKMTEAIGVLRSASMKFEDNQDILRRLAGYYFFDSSYEDAARIYWRMLENTTDLSGKLALVNDLADIAEMQSTTDKLLRHFETRAQTNKQSVFPLLALSTIHRNSGNYEERRMYLIKAAQLRPNDVEMLHEIARVEAEEGDYDRAVSTLERAVLLDKTPKTKQKLARYHIQYGDEEKGYRMLFELAGGKQMDAATAEKLADTLMTGQSYERAEEFLNEILPLHPGNYRLGFLRAVALEESDRILESKEAFLRLLDIKDEIVGRPKKQQQSLMRGMYGSYYQGMTEMFGPGAIELMELQGIEYQVYSYRQSRGGMWFGPFGRQGQQGSIPLPQSIDELEKYVIGHLIGVSRMLDDEEIDQVVRSLESRGVTYAEIKLKMSLVGDDDPEFWNEMRQKYAGDTTITAIWLFAAGFEGRITQEELKEAYEQLKGTNAQLAIAAVLMSMNRMEVDEEMVNEALDMLRRIEKPNAFILYGLVMGRFMDEGAGPELSEAMQQKLSSTLLEVYPRVKKDAMMSEFVFVGVLGVLAQTDSYEKMVELVEEEAAQKGKGQQGMYSRMYGHMMMYMQGEGLSQLLSFPPEDIPEFPSTLIQVFSYEEDGYSPMEVMLDPEKLWPHVGAVKEPILKIVMSAFCEKEEETSALVDELLAAEKPSLKNIIVAASWKGQQEEHGEVIKILSKARYLPMNRQRRQWIDSAILGHALEIKDQEEARTAGKDAALRLRRYQLTYEQREELADVLEELGLKEEAAQVARKTSQQPTMSGFPGGISPPMRGGPSGSRQERIEELIAEGKKEQAVNLLVKDYRVLVGQVLHPQYSGMSRYEIEQFSRQIISLNLIEDFLKELEVPQDNQSARKRVELAYAYEILNKEEQALIEYEKILTIKPNSPFTNTRVALLVSETDPAKAREHVEKAAGKNPHVMGSTLVEQLGEADTLRERLKYMPLLVRLVEVSKGKQTATGPWAMMGMNWLTMAFHGLERETWDDEPEIPGLFDPELQEATKSLPTESQELVQRRYDLYEQLCDAAISVGETADFAFSRKVHLYRILGKAEEPLAEDARNILLNPQKKSRQSQVMHFFGYSDGAEVENISPGLFLVARAYADQKQGELEEFVAKLDPAKHKDTIEEINSLKGLYEATGEEFIQAAKSHQETATSYMGAVSNKGQKLCEVVQIWSQAKKEVSLTPLIVEGAKSLCRGNTFAELRFAGRWIREVFKQQGEEAAADVLDQLAVSIFGEKALEKSSDESGSSRRGRNPMQMQKVMAYGQFLSEVLNEDELVFPIVKHAQKVSVLAEYSDEAMDFVDYRLGERIGSWGFIKQSPLVKDWEEFSAGSLGVFSEEYASILETVVDRSKNRGSRRKKEMLKNLKELEPKTFGIGLLTVLIEKDSAEDVFGYLGPYLAQISQEADEEKMMEVLTGLRGCVSDLNDIRTPEGEQARAFYDFYEKKTKDEMPDQAEAFLQKKISDRHGPWEWNEEAAKVVRRLLPVDEAKAEEVYNHAVKELKNYQKRSGRGRVMARFGHEQTAEGELLEAIVERGHEADMHTLRFAWKKMQSKDVDLGIGSYSRGDYSSWRFREIMETRYDQVAARLKEEGVDEKQRRSAALVEALEEMDEFLGGAMVPNVSEAADFRSFRKEELQAVVDSIRQERQEGVEPSLFLREIAIVLEQRILWKERKRDALAADYVPFYMEVIGNEDISLGWRMMVCIDVLEELDDHAELRVFVDPAVDMLLECPEEVFAGDDVVEEVVGAFNDQAVDEAWKVKAGQICERWRKQALSTRTSRSRGQYSRHMLDVNHVMLETHLKLEDSENVTRILNSRSLKLYVEPTTYSLLLKYPEQKDWVITSLESKWKIIDCTAEFPKSYSLCPDMRALADEVVAAMSSEDLRYYADVLFSSFRQCSVYEDGRHNLNKTKAQAKLGVLAKDFSGRTFTDNAVRVKCLDMLMRGDNMRLLKDELYAACANETALAVAMSEHDSAESREERYLAYLLFCLEDGKIEEFEKAIKSLEGSASFDRRRWEIQQMMEELGEVLNEYLCGDYTGAGDTWGNEPADYLRLGKTIVGKQRHMYGDGEELCYAMMALHFVCDEQGQLKTWIDSLKEKPDRQRYSHDEYLPVFSRSFKSCGDDKDKQVKVAEGLLAFVSSEDVQPYLRSGRYPVGSMLKHEAVAENEPLRSALAAKLREDMDSDDPEVRRQARAVIGLEIQALVGRSMRESDPDKAEKILQEALALDPENVRARVRLVRHCLRRGQKEKSLELARQYGALMEIPELPAAPVIDGDPSDDVWTKAYTTEEFYVTTNSRLAERTKGRSKAYIGHREGKIYMAVIGYEKDLSKLLARHTERDSNVWSDDCAELLFDPNNTDKRYFQFVINSAGALYDSANGKVDKNFECEYGVDTFEDRGYWACEFAIDSKELSDEAVGPGTIWSICAFRSRFGAAKEHGGIWPLFGGTHNMHLYPLSIFQGSESGGATADENKSE